MPRSQALTLPSLNRLRDPAWSRAWRHGPWPWPQQAAITCCWWPSRLRQTHLAHQLPKLLPPLSRSEALTITRIQSVVGQLCNPGTLPRTRPFRAPHHSCSAAALLGGGVSPQPGELSLAHGGVLFLDELAEFPRAVLDQLRQPLEEGVLRLSRSRLKTSFPAAITLVAATNPCPCGWHGVREHGCRCSVSQRLRYWQRLSGPLLDRLDLQLRLERPLASRVRRCLEPTPSARLEPWLQAGCINSARQRMQERNPGGRCNRDLSAEDFGRVGRLEREALQLWEHLISNRRLTTRSALRLLQVARTIADLNGKESVRRRRPKRAVTAAPTHWSGALRMKISGAPFSRAPCEREHRCRAGDRSAAERDDGRRGPEGTAASPNQWNHWRTWTSSTCETVFNVGTLTKPGNRCFHSSSTLRCGVAIDVDVTKPLLAVGATAQGPARFEAELQES